MSQNWLIDNAWIVTFGDPCAVIEDGAVLLLHGLVAAVGPRAHVAARLPSEVAVEILDAGGAVVTPGLVNAHTHLYSTFACGYAPPPSHNFQEILENLWWPLDRALTLEDVRTSALVAAARCLLAGVTTIVDHHASYGAIRGSLGVIAEVVRSLGLRACLAYEVSDRWGDEATTHAIEENECFLSSLPGRRDGDLAGLFGLHASFTLSDRTLHRCVEAARRAGAPGFHVHCAEDLADVSDARGRGFAGAVDRLQSAGILRPRTLAAHCIHLTKAEASMLAETGTIPVINPQSNMNNAVGVADVEGLLEAGCVVALGSDGMTADILEEVRAAIFTRRQEVRDPTRMFGPAVRALTVSNPYVASQLFGKPIGVLCEGAAGDVVVWDYHPATPLHEGNVGGHLVFGLPSSRVRDVIAAGRLVVRNGTLADVDLVAETRIARSRAAAVWQRMVGHD